MDIYLGLVRQIHHIAPALSVSLPKGYADLLPHLNLSLKLLRYSVLECPVHIFMGNIYDNTGISMRHLRHLSVLLFCTWLLYMRIE